MRNNLFTSSSQASHRRGSETFRSFAMSERFRHTTLPDISRLPTRTPLGPSTNPPGKSMAIAPGLRRPSTSRNRKNSAKTSGITGTERTPIRDHRDKANEEPAPTPLHDQGRIITPLRSLRGTRSGACARALIHPTFTPYNL
jgi:hypothetical protein